MAASKMNCDQTIMLMHIKITQTRCELSHLRFLYGRVLSVTHRTKIHPQIPLSVTLLIKLLNNSFCPRFVDGKRFGGRADVTRVNYTLKHLNIRVVDLTITI